MHLEKYYKNLFLIGGIWNIGTGLPIFILSFFTDALYPVFGMEKPNSLIWLHVSLICIVIYGIGYILVYRDIESNHGIVIIGSLGRFSFFIITIFALVGNDANFLFLLLGIVDFIFVILNCEFLLNQRKNP
jgi:hypothetical protein